MPSTIRPAHPARSKQTGEGVKLSRLDSDNQNVFAGAFVDRNGERRKDPDWIADTIDSDDARFVPVWGARCLLDRDEQSAALLTRSQACSAIDTDELIFLGIFRNHPAFAADYGQA